VLIWDGLTSLTRSTSEVLNRLGNESLRLLPIDNGVAPFLWDLSDALLDQWINMVYIGRWLDDAESRLAQILSWGSIRANIEGTWSWLNTIDDKIWWRAYNMTLAYWSWLNTAPDTIWGWMYDRIMGRWSWLNSAPGTIWGWMYSYITARWAWLNTIDDRIWSTAGSRIRATWSWLDSIDDRIRDTVVSRWSWINTIDDKIRTVAWDYVLPKLGDWLLSWLMLNLTIWGRIGYRILDKVWNMEWDDTRKEVK